MESFLSPDNHWALWAVLLCAAAFGLWAERTKWGAKLSGAVLAIGCTFVLSNLGLIPADAPAYGVVWGYVVPLAIPLLLLNADLKRILKESGPTLLAFLAGGVGTVIGTVVAFHTIPLGPEGHKLAGIFCATYIGGSVNYMAASQALDLQSGDLLTAGMAADNLVMTLYFLLLFALPSIGSLRRRYADRGYESSKTPLESSEAQPKAFVPMQAAAALALAAVLCAVGFGIEGIIGWTGSGILIITALAVALASLFPQHIGTLTGSRELGTILMMIFFGALGASANIGVVLKQGPILFVFAAVILLVHLVILLVSAKLMRLDLIEVVIASNANMGGPTTAAAMAVARGWQALVTPAILCGTLGYAVATFVGTAVGLWLA